MTYSDLCKINCTLTPVLVLFVSLFRAFGGIMLYPFGIECRRVALCGPVPEVTAPTDLSSCTWYTLVPSPAGLDQQLEHRQDVNGDGTMLPQLVHLANVGAVTVADVGGPTAPISARPPATVTAPERKTAGHFRTRPLPSLIWDAVSKHRSSLRGLPPASLPRRAAPYSSAAVSTVTPPPWGISLAPRSGCTGSSSGSAPTSARGSYRRRRV